MYTYWPSSVSLTKLVPKKNGLCYIHSCQNMQSHRPLLRINLGVWLFYKRRTSWTIFWILRRFNVRWRCYSYLQFGPVWDFQRRKCSVVGGTNSTTLYHQQLREDVSQEFRCHTSYVAVCCMWLKDSMHVGMRCWRINIDTTHHWPIMA